MKRVVISDIHIGSQYFKAVELLRFLSEVEYDELILAGDIIDFIKVPEFTDRALAIAQLITQRLSFMLLEITIPRSEGLLAKNSSASNLLTNMNLKKAEESLGLSMGMPTIILFFRTKYL